MKKFLLVFTVVSLVSAASIYVGSTEAQIEKESAETQVVSPNIVISQFQVAGGVASDEFIELHNISSNSVDLNGYRVVYRSAGGTNDNAMVEWTTSTIVPAGAYYLVVSSTYDGSVPGNGQPYNTSMVSMSATGGGIGLRIGALNTGVLIDSVGYGTATNSFIESTVTTAPLVNTSQSRASNGCQDTDNNANDFSNTNPAVPRNASSPVITCAGGGGSLLAELGANPTSVSPGSNILFSMTVLPATNPPSTGIAVSGNLSSIGGANPQQLFDDGTNGDVTPGDNVFSYLATVPLGISGGTFNVSATATDAQSRSITRSVSITINAPPANDDPLIFGNPSNATGSVANENNYLMQKPQYSLSYNRSKATPNWVAWRLDSTWVGTAPRQDDYRPDPALPAGWYQVQDNDYSGSGYDRGHMCPSGDRTRSIPDNSATFLMTNFVPQLSANNQGPWEEFETYCRTLASQGNEIYIITGPNGNIGTIAQGRVVVPQYTWKVVLVIPNGNNDVARASSKATRVFGIIVPNFPPLNINAPWRDFRVTVNDVEYLTGHNFFTQIPKITQELIERKRDRL